MRELIPASFMPPAFDGDILLREKKSRSVVEFVLVGRFVEAALSNRKCQHVAIEAFAETAQKENRSDFRLSLVGSVADQVYYEKCKHLAGQKNNELNIQFRTSGVQYISLQPNASDADVQAAYIRANFLLCLGGYPLNYAQEPHAAEHLGLPPLEALAAGTIPIVYEPSGSTKLLLFGLDSFIIRNFDELKSALCLAGLIKNTTHYESMVQSALERAEEFSRGNYRRRFTSILLEQFGNGYSSPDLSSALPEDRSIAFADDALTTLDGFYVRSARALAAGLLI